VAGLCGVHPAAVPADLGLCRWTLVALQCLSLRSSQHRGVPAGGRPEWVSRATSYHKELGKLILLGLVALHLLAIAYYRVVRKARLVGPMISGDKVVDAPAIGSADSGATRLLALGVLALCAGVVYAVVQLGGGAPAF